MKTAERTNDTHFSGVQETIKFRVESTPKMMSLLSDSPYSDCILACVRELSTNAVDAHLDAGNEKKPFDIYLPTRDKLEFCIRDYGTGMPQEKIEQLYTTYGASDKDDTNDYNGCMGIGSKVPFSYADSFTVVSYYNGKKLMYVAAKDKTGMYTLNRMCIEDTDEPNGLQISFRIKYGDEYRFYSRAQDVFQYLPITPNVVRNYTPNEPFALNPKVTPLYKDTNWAVTPSINDSSRCVMGYIAYPIDSYQFKGRHRDLIHMGVKLYAGIGDVDMDISRESLRYTDETKRWIEVQLDVMDAYVVKEVSHALDDCKTEWEACNKYVKLSYDNNFKVLFNIVKDVKWGNTTIHRYLPLKTFKGNLTVVSTGRKRKTNKLSAMNGQRVKIVVNDMKIRGFSAAANLVAEGKADYVYVLSYSRTKHEKNFIPLTVDEVLKDTTLAIDDFEVASTLPLPPKTKRIGGSYTIKEMEFNPLRVGGINSGMSASRWWKETNVDFDNGGCYVGTSRYQVMTANGDRRASYLKDMLSNLEAASCKVIPDTVIGVKAAHLKKYEKSPLWINFFDLVDKWLNELVVKEKISQVLSDIRELQNFPCKAFYESLQSNIIQDSHVVDVNSSLHSLINKLKERQLVARAKSTVAYKVESLSGSFNIKLDVKEQAELMDITKKVEARYPMLLVVRNSSYGNVSKADTIPMVDYINLVESK